MASRAVDTRTSDDVVGDQAAPLREIGLVDLYQRREKIYTRAMQGFYQRIRLYTGWPLLLGYFLLPWIQIDGRQAILFDVPNRQFHIFWMTFWPQDFHLLAWLLIIAAFGLFAITNFAGRVWCGYTCPQTVWTAIFMWAEQLTEGDRHQRMKRDKQTISLDKVVRKLSKHAIWIGFAFLTGFTFIAYFQPAYSMAGAFFLGQSALWIYAWVLLFTIATYVNAGWLREQVCMYMCPYARFQSAMFDRDTLIVSYDPGRGEPRGSRRRDAAREVHGKGDCIDCKLCVQVCPTGIDIRDGLQYQCITCALCIDACDSVMDKMNYPRGLIRYTTQRNLEGSETRVLRPKMLGYIALMVVMILLFLATLGGRTPLQLDVIRDRGQLYQITADGWVENVYQLRILNKADASRQFLISVEGAIQPVLVGAVQLEVQAGEVALHSVRLRAAPESLQSPVSEVFFSVRALDHSDLSTTRETTFIAP